LKGRQDREKSGPPKSSANLPPIYDENLARRAGQIIASAPVRHAPNVSSFLVLEGWIKSEFEGQVTMREGAAWLQPPRIKHIVHYSDDCEVLEIILPAEFKTVELE
jgi:hypothetical protein